MTESYEDRRRFPRISSECPVHVKKLGADDLEGPATATQFGLGGCRFIATESVGEGASVEIMMDLHLRFITARGLVVYELTLEDGTFDVGVQFTTISEADREILASYFETRSTP
jgi:c-di-GMP-binding flagellar brake protein YcgR